jgi:hypothetical protein
MENPSKDRVSSMQSHTATSTASLSTVSACENKAATFHPFPRLPVELRLEMWRLAADEPRVVPVISRNFLTKSNASFNSPGPKHFPHREKENVPHVFIPSSYVTPALTRVNKESRLIALELCPEDKWTHSGQLRFRAEKDILYFPSGYDLYGYVFALAPYQREYIRLGPRCRKIVVGVDEIVDPEALREVREHISKDTVFTTMPHNVSHTANYEETGIRIQNWIESLRLFSIQRLRTIILLTDEDKSFDTVSQRLSASTLTTNLVEDGIKKKYVPPKVEELNSVDWKAKVGLPN